MSLKYEPSSEPQYGFTVLLDSAFNGHGSVVQVLLKAGADSKAALKVRTGRLPISGLGTRWSHWLDIGAIGLVDKSTGSGESVSSVPRDFQPDSARLSVTVSIGTTMCRYGMAFPRVYIFSLLFSSRNPCVVRCVGGEGAFYYTNASYQKYYSICVVKYVAENERKIAFPG